ncbi:MAG: hypothetical protein ACOVT5_06700, partial [Armatimonadaceae bacterium]
MIDGRAIGVESEADGEASRTMWNRRDTWVLWSALLALLAGAVHAQSPASVAWTGEPGTVETTGQIMARQKYSPKVVPLVRKFEQENEERRSIPQDPGSPAVAQVPAPEAGAAVAPALLRSPVAR